MQGIPVGAANNRWIALSRRLGRYVRWDCSTPPGTSGVTRMRLHARYDDDGDDDGDDDSDDGVLLAYFPET